MLVSETLNWARIFRTHIHPPRLLRPCLLLVLCLLAGVGGSLRKVSAGDARSLELTPGTANHYEIAAGEKELFEIPLSGKQLLQFSLDKGDLALSLTLYNPEGQKLIAEMSRAYEDLEISHPADSAGTYRLEINSLERTQSRHYQLRVAPLRTPTPADRKAQAAQQLEARASWLRADWTERSFRQAISDYDEAAILWISTGRQRSAAMASMNAGSVYFLLGQYREALKRYQRAAEEARAAGARLEEYKALSQAGRLYSYLGNNDQAQATLLTALEFLAPQRFENQPSDRQQAYAQTLSNLGEVNYSKGNLVKSSADFERALAGFGEVGDRSGAAAAHLFMGYIAGGIGSPEKAVAEISRALSLYQEVTNKRGEGLCLTALGLSDCQNRNEEHAIKLHREASAIFRTIGDRQSEGITLNALGQAYEFLSDYPTALENYRQALRLFQEHETLDFAAVSMFKVARMHRLLGDIPKALADYEQTLKLSRGARKTRTEANALNDLALIYATQGGREKTVRQYQKILRFYIGIGDRRGQAMAWNNLGDFLLRRHERQQALESYKRALPLGEQADDKDLLISTLYNIARADRDLGMLEDAQSAIEHSIKIIEDLRDNLSTPDFRTSYFAGVRRQYDLYIDVLMQLDLIRPGRGFAAKAFLVSEKARARSLVDLLREAGAGIRQDADPTLLERERELQGLLRSQARYQMEFASGGANHNESEEVRRQIVELRTEYQEVEGQLRVQSPRFLAMAQPPALSLDQIQAQLRDGDTILLEYALGDERSYLWAVTSDSLRSYELPPRAALEDAGREVYQLITARQATGEMGDGGYQARVASSDQFYVEKARNLSNLMFGPVSAQLGSKRLLIVSEGVLQYIPVDALPAPAGPSQQATAAEDQPLLIATHEIVTLPSVSTLAAIRQEQHGINSRNKLVAVLADPVFSSDDDRVQKGNQSLSIASPSPEQSPSEPRDLESVFRGRGMTRLAHASEEADEILAATPQGAGLVARGFDASRETAMSSLIGKYQIVHFATHGFVNGEHPEFSGVVLTMVNQDGSQTNGFMPLQDIYNLKLSADLIVLSACDTALGKDVKGEGLVSLTRGFMSAGAKSVVASLWKVDDRATAVLMANFYKSMFQDGLPPAAALRSAKQKLRQERAWSAPYYWAGFVIQGEYQDHIVVETNSGLRSGVAIAMTLVAISIGLIILKRRQRSYLARQQQSSLY